MDLDEINPEVWRRLLAATQEYCVSPEVAAQFDELADILTSGLPAGGAGSNRPPLAAIPAWRKSKSQSTEPDLEKQADTRWVLCSCTLLRLLQAHGLLLGATHTASYDHVSTACQVWLSCYCD